MILRQSVLHGLGRRSVGVLFTIAVLVVMVRPLPLFPDLMWEGLLFAINRAVATGLQFGRDVIFTHGPYATVYTSRYFPGLEHLRLGGQILIALAYSASLLTLFRGHDRWFLVLFLYVMTIVEKPFFCDAVFYILPWLFVVLAFRYDRVKDAQPEWRSATQFGFLAVTLSLVALVKASFTLAAFFLVALALYLLSTRSKRLALAVGGLFGAGLLSFWMLAGQPVSMIVHSFIAQIPMVTGYTDAVSTFGRRVELVGYLVLSFIALGLLGLRLFRGDGATARSSIVLLALAAILFLGFKAAFVRHTAHGMIAADMIALVSLTLVPLLPRWSGLPLLSAALVFWGAVNAYYAHQPVPYLPHPRLNPLRSGYWSELVTPLVEGIRSQLDPDRLQAHYRRSLERLAEEIPLPAVRGSTEIQDSRYDLLEAHAMEISQRPIPEGYAAWTPELARLNAAHFDRADGPQNVFFRVSGLDHRLPALEDSLSWPIWLSSYEIRPEACPPYMLLTRRNDVVSKPKFTSVVDRHARMGEDIALPQDQTVLWAEIEVPSTFVGSAASLLFKRPGLTITYRYRDGARASFRYIEGMGRAGFLLSPVVRDNADFNALHAQRFEHFAGRVPVSFSLQPNERGERFWSDAYRLRMFAPAP